MPKKKSPSQILHSYTGLISRVKTEEASLPVVLSVNDSSVPQSSLPQPEYDLECINGVSLEDLNHLRDLLHLKKELSMLSSRFPLISIMHFVSPPQHFHDNPYEQTDYTRIEETNIGRTALSLKSAANR